jgi:ribosomal-protein-alanine N-acetyltransferase
MLPTLTSRLFKADDLAQIQGIYDQCFKAGDGDYWTPKMVVNFPTEQGSMIFVLEAGQGKNKKIVGFIFTISVLDEAELLAIGLGATYRGKGFSGQLLDFSVKILKADQILNIFLEVKENNVPALKLYQSRGFIEVGIRPDYYKNENEKSINAKIFSLKT